MTGGLDAASIAPTRALERRLEDIPAAAWLAAVLIAAVLLMSLARGPVAVGQTTLNGLVAAGYFALGRFGNLAAVIWLSKVVQGMTWTLTLMPVSWVNFAICGASTCWSSCRLVPWLLAQ